MLSAEALTRNLQSYAASHPITWDQRELDFFVAACPLFCRHLLDDGSRSLVYAPGSPPDIIKEVDFQVMLTPAAEVTLRDGTVRALTAACRKLRAKPGFGCCPCEQSVEQFALDASLDVQLEVRRQAQDGRQIDTYAIYLPPFMPPINWDAIPKDMTVCRLGAMLRYAKTYKEAT